MSPAINDPFTALTCLDYLTDGLAKYACCSEISPNFYDQDGRLCLIYEPADLYELLEAAFNMLRHANCDNANVLPAMLDAIEDIGREIKSPEARQELLRHVKLVQAESQAVALIEADRLCIRPRCKMLETILKTEGI
jgi:uncharacterized membrane protein